MLCIQDIYICIVYMHTHTHIHIHTRAIYYMACVIRTLPWLIPIGGNIFLALFPGSPVQNVGTKLDFHFSEWCMSSSCGREVLAIEEDGHSQTIA